MTQDRPLPKTERRAQALRENLSRRKQQQRARAPDNASTEAARAETRDAPPMPESTDITE